MSLLDKKQIREEQRDNILQYISYFNQLIILSGSAIVLSITYLGYLKQSELEINLTNNKWFLMASWVYFAVSIATSVFRNYTHVKYRQVESVRYAGYNDPKNLLEKNISKKINFLMYSETFANIFFIAGLVFLILFAIKTSKYF